MVVTFFLLCLPVRVVRSFSETKNNQRIGEQGLETLLFQLQQKYG